MHKSFSCIVLALAVALHGVKANYIDLQNSVPSIPSTHTVTHNLLHNAAHQASIMPAYLSYSNVPFYTSDLKNRPNKITLPVSVVPSQLYYSQTSAKMPSSVYCFSSQVYGSQLPNNEIKYSSYQLPTMYNKLTAPVVNAGTPTTYESSAAAY